jgi:hypothetical protein
MSTLRIQAPQAPQFPLSGFGRLVSALVMALDVIADAQQQARAAHKRYPFADW